MQPAGPLGGGGGSSRSGGSSSSPGSCATPACLAHSLPLQLNRKEAVSAHVNVCMHISAGSGGTALAMVEEAAVEGGRMHCGDATVGVGAARHARSGTRLCSGFSQHTIALAVQSGCPPQRSAAPCRVAR